VESLLSAAIRVSCEVIGKMRGMDLILGVAVSPDQTNVHVTKKHARTPVQGWRSAQNLLLEMVVREKGELLL